MEQLKKLHTRKVRLKLRYLQTELEETRLIYKNSLEKFNKDFSGELVDTSTDELIRENSKAHKDPYEKINSDVDDDTIKEVYRKVAGKTHPDKKDGDEKLFISANKANQNRDFGQLLELADELGIDINVDDKMVQQMKNQCSGIIKNIELMKTTMAWTWSHIPEEQKESFKLYILSTLNPPE
jgi:hypothetical protein